MASRVPYDGPLHYGTSRTAVSGFVFQRTHDGLRAISCPEASYDFFMLLPIRPQHVRRKVTQGDVHKTLIFVGRWHLGVVVEKTRHVLLVDLSVVEGCDCRSRVCVVIFRGQRLESEYAPVEELHVFIPPLRDIHLVERLEVVDVVDTVEFLAIFTYPYEL